MNPATNTMIVNDYPVALWATVAVDQQHFVAMPEDYISRWDSVRNTIGGEMPQPTEWLLRDASQGIYERFVEPRGCTQDEDYDPTGREVAKASKGDNEWILENITLPPFPGEP